MLMPEDTTFRFDTRETFLAKLKKRLDRIKKRLNI